MDGTPSKRPRLAESSTVATQGVEDLDLTSLTTDEQLLVFYDELGHTPDDPSNDRAPEIESQVDAERGNRSPESVSVAGSTLSRLLSPSPVNSSPNRSASSPSPHSSRSPMKSSTMGSPKRISTTHSSVSVARSTSSSGQEYVPVQGETLPIPPPVGVPKAGWVHSVKAFDRPNVRRWPSLEEQCPDIAKFVNMCFDPQYEKTPPPLPDEDTILDFLHGCSGHMDSVGADGFVKIHGRAVLFGDTHGSLAHTVFKRHLVDEEANVIFLGDFIDRGRFQLQNVVILFFMYMSSQRCVLINGNHELPGNSHRNDYNGYDCQVSARISDATSVLFSKLPFHGVLDNLLYFSHGGYTSFGPRVSLSAQQKDRLCWGDPICKEVQHQKESLQNLSLFARGTVRLAHRETGLLFVTHGLTIFRCFGDTRSKRSRDNTLVTYRFQRAKAPTFVRTKSSEAANREELTLKDSADADVLVTADKLTEYIIHSIDDSNGPIQVSRGNKIFKLYRENYSAAWKVTDMLEETHQAAPLHEYSLNFHDVTGAFGDRFWRRSGTRLDTDGLPWANSSNYENFELDGLRKHLQDHRLSLAVRGHTSYWEGVMQVGGFGRLLSVFSAHAGKDHTPGCYVYDQRGLVPFTLPARPNQTIPSPSTSPSRSSSSSSSDDSNSSN